MVMHARKTQRISDGYFEKHQSHPYQNSKYGSSKSGSYGGSQAPGGSDRYDRMRDSPNGNSYRSDSPDSQSPRDRDRSYQNKSSYLQKIRDKERENRDYKSSSRDKYSDCVRSPKDKRSRDTRDSEHRTNHDRGDDKMILHSIKIMNRDRKPAHNCQDKREERERINRVGDWSEHMSSSGKKYYYNCKTEVSQWEKPREWVERERERERDRDRDRDRSSRSSCKDRSGERGSEINDRGVRESYVGRSSSSIHDKHSTVSRSSSSNRDKPTSSRLWECEREREREREPAALPETRRRSEASADTQDMDISPGDSTPTSEASREPQPEQMIGPVLLATALPRLTSSTPPQAPPMVPPPISGAPPPGQAPGPPPNMAVQQQPPVSLSSLPRLLSQMSQHKSMESTDSMQNIHSALLMTSRTDIPASVAQPLKVETATSHTVSEGPPTPTHSEGQDYTATDSRKLNSPPSSLSSLGALRPQGPSLTPSLSNHYRDDLVNHIRGWPADILEKQAQKLEEEAHVTGSLQCTKVSADLKIARSLVRLTEIQATLQEQRILFLRQQIKTLEELKSQNSFMSDDS